MSHWVCALYAHTSKVNLSGGPPVWECWHASVAFPPKQGTPPHPIHLCISTFAGVAWWPLTSGLSRKHMHASVFVAAVASSSRTVGRGFVTALRTCLALLPIMQAGSQTGSNTPHSLRILTTLCGNDAPQSNLAVPGGPRAAMFFCFDCCTRACRQPSLVCPCSLDHCHVSIHGSCLTLMATGSAAGLPAWPTPPAPLQPVLCLCRCVRARE